MIWHIFKKDIRLLWPWIVVWLLLRLGVCGIKYYESGLTLVPASGLWRLGMAALSVLWCYLVVAAVWQERVPGFRQDWLVRPMRRGDVVLAKMLFVLFLEFLALEPAILDGLASGLQFREALAAALQTGLYWMFCGGLPLMALASMFDGQLAMLLVSGGVLISCNLMSVGGPLSDYSFFNSGLTWIPVEEAHVFVLATCSVVVAWTYWQRSFKRAHMLTAVLICVCWLLPRITPFAFAFTVQRMTSPDPEAGRNVQLVYAAHAPEVLSKFPDKAGLVAVKGLPRNWQLRVDRYVWNIYGSDTAKIPAHNNRPVGDVLWDRQDGGWLRDEATPVPWLAQGAGTPQAEPASIDYSLTLLRPVVEASMPVLGGNQRLPRFGRCVTSPLSQGNDLSFTCYQSKMPSCFSLTVEGSQGVRKGEDSWCLPNYSPFSESPEIMAPQQLSVHFDGPAYPDTRLIVRIYEPASHFKRHVMVPDFPAKKLPPQ